MPGFDRAFFMIGSHLWDRYNTDYVVPANELRRHPEVRSRRRIRVVGEPRRMAARTTLNTILRDAAKWPLLRMTSRWLRRLEGETKILGAWVPAPYAQLRVRAGTTIEKLRFYPCSACNSFRIASPICDVLTTVVPSDLISAVRRPAASTAAMAASSLSASAPISNE